MFCRFAEQQSFLYGLVVRIPGFHPGGLILLPVLEVKRSGSQARLPFKEPSVQNKNYLALIKIGWFSSWSLNMSMSTKFLQWLKILLKYNNSSSYITRPKSALVDDSNRMKGLNNLACACKCVFRCPTPPDSGKALRDGVVVSCTWLSLYSTSEV